MGRILLDELPQRWIACAIMLLGLGIGLPTLPPLVSADYLVARLEQRFVRGAIGNGAGLVGVIALGGNLDRVREAGRLARLYPHLLVVVSGAGSRAVVLPLLGPDIDDDRLLVEEASRNTYENAVFSSAIIGARSAGRWLLVTSASHMPRAIGTFRQHGVDVEPWPIFDLAHAGAPLESVARHETLGLLAYRLLGRSNALFPSNLDTTGPTPQRKNPVSGRGFRVASGH